MIDGDLATTTPARRPWSPPTGTPPTSSIQLREGEENAKLADLEAIRPVLAAGGGVETEVGGLIPFLGDANSQIENDIIRAEMLSLPILLVLLILIFRGLVAAATPLLVGVLAILGAFIVVRLLAGFTEVSVFAANVITMLGLGMAIDYALFVVSRFREELAAGHADAGARSRAPSRRPDAPSRSPALTVALALSCCCCSRWTSSSRWGTAAWRPSWWRCWPR